MFRANLGSRVIEAPLGAAVAIAAPTPPNPEIQSLSYSSRSLLNSGLWTAGAYAGSILLKFGSNVILSRLLSPNIFGIMVVVNSIKVGIELLTDVGIEQNIVHHDRGLDPDFFNTAWTIQIIRGALLTALFIALAYPLSAFYGIDRRVFAVIGLAPFLNSLHSTSVFALSKNLEVKRRNLFEMISEALAFALAILFAAITPTVWALVLGALVAITSRTFLSYVLPHPPHRLILRKAHAHEILHFGKWIFLSSALVYVATNIDRIALGKIVPLGVLGVYGLARTIADLGPTLANRVSYQILFPYLSATKRIEALSQPGDLASTRWKFLFLAAVTISAVAAWSDRLIRVIYDARYQSAGWMLSLLMAAAWVSILAALSESVILGIGRPAYNSVANVARISILVVGLPISYAKAGLVGVIITLTISELARYLTLIYSQKRPGLPFVLQDLGATAILIVTSFGWIMLRHAFGLGMPWTI